MKVHWTSIGAEYTEDKERVSGIISRMEWEPPQKGKLYPMSQAMGISGAIKEYKIPKVSAISWSCHEFAPFGLLGIEGNYSNGKVRIFFVDDGCGLTPICTHVLDN